MIHFEWPWLCLIFPLAFLVRWLLSPQLAMAHAALKIPFLNDFTDAKSDSVSQNSAWRLRLAMAAWLLLVLASTRPQWLGEPIEQAVSGRDLMLAVDLSLSMRTKDFVLNHERVNRLTAAKAVATDFINRRVGDRIGLIFFGEHPYLKAPLTFDRKTVNTFLDKAFLGMADQEEGGTVIGDAIGLAIKKLRAQPENSRVLILMTDGVNNGGEVSPLKAAELAVTHHLKIYTIGIGADEIITQDSFGNRYREKQFIDLDEKTLIKIAESTGGHYYRARNSEELQNIYLRLDELELIEKEKQYFRPRREVYVYPLALALCVAAALALSRVRLS